MKRDVWVGPMGEAADRLDSLYMACEIVKAMASGGAGSKWGRDGDDAGKIIEETYQKVESIRKEITKGIT